MKKLLIAVAVLLTAVAGGIAWYIGATAAPVATGYAAKTVCSGHYVSERTVEDVMGDLPENPLTPYVRATADDSEGTVTARLFGVWSTTAWHTAHGCTLADERPNFSPAEGQMASDVAEVGADDLWPQGRRTNPAAQPLGDRARLELALDAAFSEEGVPDDAVRGTRAVVVVHSGRVVAERYADGFDAGTPLLGWSMSKSVANAAIGRLIGDGVLSLSDDALVSEWEDDERRNITVEHLLHMAGGLEFEEIYDVGTTATEMLFTPGSTAAVAAVQPLIADPGTHWSYSSGTSNILCEVARDTAGLAGPDMMDALVFEPLGMASAVMEPDATGLPVCSSFTYATALDWARLGQLYLQDGVWAGERLLPEGWVDFTTTPVALDNELPYGAHWWLNSGTDGQRRMPSVPADAFWASGNEGQQVVVVPSVDVVVVRLGLSQEFDGVSWGLGDLVAGVVEAVG